MIPDIQGSLPRCGDGVADAKDVAGRPEGIKGCGEIRGFLTDEILCQDGMEAGKNQLHRKTLVLQGADQGFFIASVDAGKIQIDFLERRLIGERGKPALFLLIEQDILYGDIGWKGCVKVPPDHVRVFPGGDDVDRPVHRDVVFPSDDPSSVNHTGGVLDDHIQQHEGGKKTPGDLRRLLCCKQEQDDSEQQKQLASDHISQKFQRILGLHTFPGACGDAVEVEGYSDQQGYDQERCIKLQLPGLHHLHAKAKKACKQVGKKTGECVDQRHVTPLFSSDISVHGDNTQGESAEESSDFPMRRILSVRFVTDTAEDVPVIADNCTMRQGKIRPQK